MDKRNFDVMERDYERKQIRLTEDFLRILKLKEETYSMLTNALIESMTLREERIIVLRDLECQIGWTKELESVIPKDVIKKLRKKYVHTFHVQVSQNNLPEDSDGYPI